MAQRITPRATKTTTSSRRLPQKSPDSSPLWRWYKPSFPMSDNWMIVIPVDPVAVPPKERTKAAFELLCALRSEAQDAELHISDTPEFFDGGSNFESVFCPFCQTDIWDWWIKAIDEWWNGTNHRALSAEMPCCGRVITL